MVEQLRSTDSFGPLFAEEMVDVSPPEFSAYALVPGICYSHALASNPVREVDGSSPWWQGRVASRSATVSPDHVLDPVPDHAFFEEGYFGHTTDRESRPPKENAVIYVDLGYGVLNALSIGLIMPVRKVPTTPPLEPVPEPQAVPAPAAAAEGQEDGGWNEAIDEMPSWITLESLEYGGGGLMSRRASR